MLNSPTPRCFVSNFEFEHRLAHGAGWQPSQTLRRLNSELSSCWLAIANQHDILLTDTPLPEEFLQQLRLAGFTAPRSVTPQELSSQPASRHSGLHLTPWGWDASIEHLARTVGCERLRPPLDAVRRVNSRRFSWDCECALGLAPPGSARLTSLHDVEAHLAQWRDHRTKWVIKAEFGMSARERILGQGRQIETAAATWITKRARQGFELFFEPWLSPIEEVGLQFEIESDGRIRFLGGLKLFSDASGQYCGSLFPSAERLAETGHYEFSAGEELTESHLETAETSVVPEHWRPAFRAAVRVAQQAFAKGYFGPLGIDAMRHRTADGHTAWRPIQDVNARWTMGRLALGLANRLKRDEVGAWLHVGWNIPDGPSAIDWLTSVRSQLDRSVRLIATTPCELGGAPTRHGTLLLTARDRQMLEAAIAMCRSGSPAP